MKNYIKHALIFCLTIYAGYGRSSQIPTLNLTIKDGMSSNYVTDITQDKSGFLWFATQYGVSRFDGSRFTTYLKEGADVPPSLNSNNISRIAADTIHNKIWIANQWAGVNVFDCEMQTFSSYRHQENDASSLSSDAITDILITRRGEIWIATADRGINVWQPEEDRFIRYDRKKWPQLGSDRISCLAESPEGTIYIGHPGEGMTVFSPKSHTFRHYTAQAGKSSLPGNRVQAIYAGMESKIWIGTDGGLSLLDPVTETFHNFRDVADIHPTIRQNIVCVNQTADGRIWVGTTSDLCYFHIKDSDRILSGEMNVDHMYIQDVYEGISNPTVHCVFEDSFQNIWIGSHGAGGSFIGHRKPFFKSWRIEKIPEVEEGLNDKEILTICVAADESIWLGTDGGGINVYKEGKRQCIYSATTGEVSSNAYRASLRDSDGNLWFGDAYSNRVDIYKSREDKFIRYELQNKATNIYALFEDNCRNIWIGTNRGIEVYNLDTGKRVGLSKESNHLPTDIVYSITQDKNGRMWIGMLTHGVVVYPLEVVTAATCTEQVLLPIGSVNQVFRDSQDRMWGATDEGLVVFPEDDIRHYRMFTTVDGLANNTICAITEDEKKNIWVSTYYGISCYEEATHAFSNFDNFSGTLYGNYMNHSVAKSKDGTLYFGSLNGVCYFKPSERPTAISLPPVVFTDFKVYGKNYSGRVTTDYSLPMPDRKVSLKYDQNIFSISFNVMDKALFGLVEYAYRLDGLNNTWINIGRENEVTFRNIPYGHYKLQVKARYKNLQWQDTPTTLSIYIAPPLWLSWWAKSSYILLAAFFTLYIIRAYKRRLALQSSLKMEKENARKRQELNEERLTFFESITHELRTPLTLILGPLEDLQGEPNISPDQQKKFSLIHKNIIRLLNLVKQILELRKTEAGSKKLCVAQDDIAKAVREIGIKYKELNKKENVSFKIEIETKDTPLYFDKEVLTMMIDNLLSNAFKYTYEGDITLALRSIAEDGTDYVEIEVSDTGIGIPEKDLPHLFERYYQATQRKNMPGFGIGLALVKNLVDLHEGIIRADSKPGTGSSFRIRLVANNSYPNAIHLNVLPKETEKEKLNKLIALVVEDEEDIREYIADSLADSYEVMVAGNGKQGLETALASIPDVIISDVIMPFMDGFELCREIKSHVSTSHIPVILLTAKDSLQNKREGYDAGADSYITKPFSASLLKSRVTNLLETRKKIASLISSSTSLKHSIIKESLNKIDNEFIERFTRIVEQNMMEEKIDIPTIASGLSMSYSSLYRKIKALTGLSAGEFIRKLRVQKAEQLLLSGKYNISEIAHQVGLNSMSYFRECFKEEYGMSPSEYIKKIKEG